MGIDLRIFKKMFDLLGNDYLRAIVLKWSEAFSIRKDIVRLDTNNVCNIECIMCWNKPQKCTSEHYMTFENYMKVINKISGSIRFLYLSCGFEPLMTPGFSRYLSYAKQKGIPYISFATNGILLSNELIYQLVDEKIDEIIISLNGYNPDDYNRIMFRSNYNLFMEKLNILTEYKKKKNSVFPKIRLNTILMKSNLLSFRNLLDIIKIYDIDIVQFRKFDTYEGINNINEVDAEQISNIDDNTLMTILEEVKCEAVKLSKKGKQIILSSKQLLNERTQTKSQVIKPKTSCSVPFFSYWIAFDGTIKVCGFDPQGIIGNMFHDSFAQIRERCKKSLA